jgi:hypothetical protein
VVPVSVSAEFSISTTEFRLARALSTPALRVEWLEVVPVDADDPTLFWAEDDAGDFSRFERAASARDAVATLDVLADAGDRRLYRVAWASDADELLDAVRENDVVVEALGGDDERWSVRVLSPTHDDLVAFRRTCRRRAIDLTPRRVTTPKPPARRPVPDLTPTQRETLVAAYEEGYFDIPRRTTLAELGTGMGVTRQAVSDRLRRGTKALVEATLRVSE